MQPKVPDVCIGVERHKTDLAIIWHPKVPTSKNMDHSDQYSSYSFKAMEFPVHPRTLLMCFDVFWSSLTCGPLVDPQSHQRKDEFGRVDCRTPTLHPFMVGAHGDAADVLQTNCCLLKFFSMRVDPDRLWATSPFLVPKGVPAAQAAVTGHRLKFRSNFRSAFKTHIRVIRGATAGLRNLSDFALGQGQPVWQPAWFALGRSTCRLRRRAVEVGESQ